jgi:hypothetical protein
MRPSDWDFGNEVLYLLCKRYPAHDDIGVITAKVWLIGRSYAASVERYKKEPGSDFFTKILAPHLRRSHLDYRLSQLPARNADFLGHQRATIEVHGWLVASLTSILRKHARSFASKYLHFHRPSLFPIYDSRAAAAIRQLSPDTRFLSSIRPTACDGEYADFVIRAAWIIKQVQEKFGKRLSPRQLDNLLLHAWEN